MAQFSGAIRISDLNDYISPSQACVVALKGSKLQVSVDAEEVGLQAAAGSVGTTSHGVCSQLVVARGRTTPPQAAAHTLHGCCQHRLWAKWHCSRR